MKSAFAAAIAGVVILLLWFGKYWPAAQWTVTPQAQLLAGSRQVSERFGVNTSGSKIAARTDLSKALAYYLHQHPQPPNLSPLSFEFTFFDKAVVKIDSSGKPLSWKAAHGVKPNRHFTSDLDAASDAFHFLAGNQASLYHGPVRSAGDESHQQDYEWKKPVIAHSELRDRITVVVQYAVVKSAEHRVYLASGEADDDADAGDNQGYWNFLDIAFVLLCIATAVVVFGFYVLWVTRKVINHRFPLRFAGVALLLMFLVYAFESGKEDSSGMPLVFTALATLCLVAVGRGISQQARPKWMSLEQLCLLAPLAKSTGNSLAAGVLVSPLVVAVPVAVVACGLFADSSLLPHKVQLLYSRVPMLEGLDIQSATLVLGLFGFVIPALERIVGMVWLRWLILLPLGMLFFADKSSLVTGPLAAPLLAGLCTFAIFWFGYVHFDLLAVLTLHVASGLILTLSMLAQKGNPLFSTLAAELFGVLLIAYLITQRGAESVEGDPRASIPALTGFRAEREKLRAEFSVARRAQQDMLPRNPPQIPGYSLAASCTPSLEVGGDLYDFLKLADGRIGIGVADVSGKGVPAALYMTLTKGLLAAVSKQNSDLPSVIEEVNRHLQSVTRKKVFVTMALGFLDAERRLLECVRAGHNPVVWRQTAQNLTSLVSPGGLGLGITAGRIFGTQLKVAELALSEGDAVVFYSDGITEAMNSGLEQFGEQRLMEAVERADSLDAEAARDSILSEVRAFLDGVHPQDDMTIVVLRVARA